MEIKKHNEYQFDVAHTVKYISVPYEGSNTWERCEHCAFGARMALCQAAPVCSAPNRNDQTTIVWVLAK